MNRDEQIRDLEPLSLKSDPERWNRMVESIQLAAEPELARRRSVAPLGVFGLLSDWMRPALSGGFALAAAASLFLFIGGGMDSSSTLEPGLSDHIGFSEPVAAWIETGWSPSIEELLLAMETAP